MRGIPGKAVATLTAVCALVGAATLAEALFTPAPRGSQPSVDQGPVTAGTWFCPVTAREDEGSRLTVTAVGDQPSTVVVMRYKDGKVTDDPPAVVAVGQAVQIPFPPDRANEPVAVRWQGGPSVAHWRLDGQKGDSAGAPCEPGPSRVSYFAGFDTTIGTRSVLHLFNPYGEDAVARLRFSTPEGQVDLVIADNLLVQAGTSKETDLSEFQPEEPDLGVTVEVVSGRLVTQGEMAVELGAGGRAVLRPAAAPALQWAVAQVRADDTSAAWLSVQNPADHDAAIEVQVSDPAIDSPALLGETAVPAGGLVRIDLAEVSSEPDFGVTVTSVNETPVVVSASWALRTSEGRGLGVALAAPGPSREWALPAADGSAEVAIYNPGADEVTVDVIAPQGPLPEGGKLHLGPNERVTVDLAGGGAAVRVLSDRPVFAELRSLVTTDSPQLWTNIGVPAIDWTGPDTRPPVRLDPTLQTTQATSIPRD